MQPARPPLPVVLALLAGMALWLGASFIGGRREPWDGPAYWSVVYPLSILIVAVLAWCYPERPWRWAFSLFFAQFVAMLLRNGELGGLWPLGLLMFAALALPAVVVAQLLGRLSARRQAEGRSSGGK